MVRKSIPTLLAVIALASVCRAEYEPIHEPLDCMKRFRFKEFALIGWSFHKRGGGDYNEQFMKVAKGAGFNVMMDVPRMLEPARKTGMKVLVAAIWYDVPKLSKLAETTMKHPATIGYDLWDNCGNVPGPTIACSKWMLKNCPDLIAYFAENPNVGVQARTPLRVISTQNYAFGYNNTGLDEGKRQRYCHALEYDRVSANRYDMAFWPIFASLANSTVGDTEIRFQTYAAIAYGAQGVVSFAYSVNRPQWHPETGSVYKASAWTNRYVQDVVGRHVIGCRSIGVYHTPHHNDNPGSALKGGPGKIIERMDPALLAGVLVLEKDFKSKANTPAYLMVVDKRTVRSNRHRPPDRNASITFGPGADVVEILRRKTGTEADRIRVIEPAWTVSLGLEAGGGRLLRFDPPGLDDMLGREAGALYMDIVRTIGRVRGQLHGGKVTADAFEKAFVESTRKFEKLASTAGNRGDAQSKDILERLGASMARARQAAFRVQFVADGEVFTKTLDVGLKTRVAGAEIRYTLDGSAATAASTKYTGPIKLDKSATIKAVAVAPGRRELLGAAEATFTRVSGEVPEALKINFQPRGAKAPEGTLPDYGEPFAAREGGRAYGWNMDRTSAARRRRRTNDPLKSTQIAFFPGVVWEIMLDNGTYDVTVCIGDADYSIWNGSIWAEDMEFCNDLRLARGQFHEVTKSVTVSDGRLTLRSHARYRAERCTRINYVVIRKKR